ncbi:MAG: hypothetical protein PUC99_03895 [Eubacteriales bacterium]|jgi:hypothetical protein|nr:hypothetical protein [Lachnospiraceae bacterium]MDD5859466.1 hypothetical protein [Eubacteriales bacterium]MCH4063258.1 hypothetical protein [Lachnospiraceae bacterium]MCH4105081.1 hypothetical protein [Lachnospiraceae bacterium]MCI1308539.1 hypothetical protein [Lachnospiraceae bacterium]
MSDEKDERHIQQFLALGSFDEYMERFEEFHDLDAGGRTFAKRMELMESDDKYTHREKERILEKRKREIIARIQGEITRLRDEIAANGVWEERSEAWPEMVEVSFRYPDGKSGDIDRCICEAVGTVTAPAEEKDGDIENPAEKKAGDIAQAEEAVGRSARTTGQGEVTVSEAEAGGSDTAEEGLWRAKIDTGHLREIEAVTLAGEGLFRERRRIYPWEDISQTSSGQFLLRCNRVVRLEREMAHLNEYKEEYRNLRSIRDPELKKILTAYHRKISDYRQAVYEGLVASGHASARWVSEQKAYQIVRGLYPDAKFQYEPDWLYGQHLDIYVPELHMAIEYQGKQHYEPVEFFGGAEGLKERKMYDRRKRIRCEQHGVTLVRWDYDKPLTEEYFTEVLLRGAEKTQS